MSHELLSGGGLNYWTMPADHAWRKLAQERYWIAAQHARGFVLDWACSCGFGAPILLANPEVRYVWGQDTDEVAVNCAWREAAAPVARCQFCRGDIESEPIPSQTDWLVSLETLEHLADPETFLRSALRQVGEGIVVSFPGWPTVGHNPAHKHDLTGAWLQGVVRTAEAGAWACSLDLALRDESDPDAGHEYVVAVFERCGPKAGPSR